MGIIKKQSIINSVIIYTGICLGFISTIYLYPNILQPDQYGLTRLFLSISFVFTQFASLGIKSITIRFFPYFNDPKKDHNGFLFLVLAVSTIGFLLFLVFFFLFDELLINYYSENSSLFADFYLLLIPLVFGILYFDVINSFIRAKFDSIPGAIVSEVALRLITIFLLCLYFFEYLDFKLFMLAFVLSYVIQPILLLSYLFITGELKLKPNLAFLNTAFVKQMANYGVFVLLGGVTHLIVSNIDIIMLGSLSGFTSTGIYAIGYYVGSVIVVPQRAISQIAPSLLAHHIKNNNLSEVKNIYVRSSINQLIPGCLVFVGIWANLDNLMEILPAEYYSAKWVIIIIGTAKLIDMATGVNGDIIVNSAYYKFNFLATLILVFLSILLNYLLIPLYEVIGAAIATTLSVFIYNLLKGIYVLRKFRMQPLTPKILIVIVLGGLILWGSLQIGRIGNLYVDIIIRSVAITMLYSTGILLFNVSEEVNKIWVDIKNKIL